MVESNRDAPRGAPPGFFRTFRLVRENIVLMAFGSTVENVHETGILKALPRCFRDNSTMIFRVHRGTRSQPEGSKPLQVFPVRNIQEKPKLKTKSPRERPRQDRVHTVRMLPVFLSCRAYKVASLDDGGTVSIWLATEVKLADEGGSRVSHTPWGRISYWYVLCLARRNTWNRK